jgi:hypothetical protein
MREKQPAGPAPMIPTCVCIASPAKETAAASWTAAGGFSSPQPAIPETGKRLPEMSMPTRMSGSGDKADLAAVAARSLCIRDF